MRRVIVFLGLAMAAVAPAHAGDPAPPATEAPAASVDLTAIKRMLVGTWQNNADTGFTRQFNADGTMTDRYEGDDSATIHGTWIVRKGNSFPADLRGHKPPPDAVFLQLMQNGDGILLQLAALDPQAMRVVNIMSGRDTLFLRLK
jgi:hypothetical protein